MRRLPRAERRAQLLSVATSKFGERGYHPTSMDDIAEAAGVTKPVLYQHFSSKEDLYISVIQQVGEVLRERIDGFAFEGATTYDRVREGIDVFFGVFDENSNMLKLFFGSEYVTESVQEEVTRATSRAAESVGTLLLARETSPPRKPSSLVAPSSRPCRRSRAKRTAPPRNVERPCFPHLHCCSQAGFARSTLATKNSRKTPSRALSERCTVSALRSIHLHERVLSGETAEPRSPLPRPRISKHSQRDSCGVCGSQTVRPVRT